MFQELSISSSHKLRVKVIVNYITSMYLRKLSMSHLRKYIIHGTVCSKCEVIPKKARCVFVSTVKFVLSFIHKKEEENG